MLEKREGQSRMDNPGKLATLGTQDTRRRQRKQKSTTQYILNITIYKTKTEKNNTTQYLLGITIRKQTNTN